VRNDEDAGKVRALLGHHAPADPVIGLAPPCMLRAVPALHSYCHFCLRKMTVTIAHQSDPTLRSQVRADASESFVLVAKEGPRRLRADGEPSASASAARAASAALDPPAGRREDARVAGRGSPEGAFCAALAVCVHRLSPGGGPGRAAD
jgi:hypothetical protein